jgi:hypothetical protein
MDWVTDTTPTNNSTLPTDSKPSSLVAHEVSEDLAKNSYSLALQHLEHQNFIEAKAAFETVLKFDIPETPFRTRIFRASLKNLARCCESLGMFEKALELTVKATELLQRDDEDPSVWHLLRRYALLLSHVPLFKLSQSILESVSSPEWFQKIPEPKEMKYRDSAPFAGGIEQFPIMIVFTDLEKLTWTDFTNCLQEICNDESVRFHVKERGAKTENAAMTPAKQMKDAVMRNENDMGTPLSTPDKKSLVNVDEPSAMLDAGVLALSTQQLTEKDDVNEASSAIVGETKKRRESPPPVRLTKRQMMAATELQTEYDISPEPDVVNIGALLPPRDDEVSKELEEWFVSSSNDPNGLKVGSAISPIISPLVESTYAKKEHEVLLDLIWNRLIVDIRSGHEVLRIVYTYIMDRYQWIPASVVATCFRLLRYRGLHMTDEERWLGLYSIGENEDNLEGLTPMEASEMEGDIQEEIEILDYALTVANPDMFLLARKTLRRCIRRARAMQRPILGQLAIDRLTEFQHPDDVAFITSSKAKLIKSSGQELLDKILLECNTDSAKFGKDYNVCLKQVLDVCSQESSLATFASYCLDVVKKGLAKHDKQMCKSALKYLRENVSVAIMDAHRKAVDEDGSSISTEEDHERVFARLCRTFPKIVKKPSVNCVQPQLWPRLIAAMWIWASNGKNKNAPEHAMIIDYLTKSLTTTDYDNMQLAHRISAIHAMIGLEAYRSALMMWKHLNLSTYIWEKKLTAKEELDWMEIRLDFCELCLKTDPQAADVCFELLIHDRDLNQFFNATLEDDISKAKKDDTAEQMSEEMDNSFLSEIETSRWELNLRRERILNDCVDLIYFKRDQEMASTTGPATPVTNKQLTEDDVALLWEFISPHLWPTKTVKLTNVMKIQEKTSLLNVIQPYVAKAPLTETISHIERGGFWYHLSKKKASEADEGGWGNDKDESDGGDSGKEKDDEKARETKTNALLKNWYARDISVEPHRLSSLFGMAQLIYEEALSDDDEAIIASTTGGTDLVPTPDGGVPSDQADLKKKEKYQAKMSECLEYLEAIHDIFDKPQLALASSVSVSQSSGSSGHNSARIGTAFGISKVGTLVNIVSGQEDEDNDDIDVFKRSAAIVAGLYPMRNPEYADLVMREDNQVKRGVPLTQLRIIPDCVLADVLPEELDSFKIEVHQYLALVRSDLNNKELDRGLEEAISLCERVKSDCTWLFYWFKGICMDDRDSFQRAHDTITKLMQERRFKSKAQTKSFAFKVALGETTTRLCVCDLEDAEGTPEEEEVKNSCITKLKQVWKELDSGNIETARLLQELLGSEDDHLQETLDKKVLYDTDVFFLLDEHRRREWDSEMEMAVQARMKALKEREKPFQGILTLFETFRLRKGRMKDVKRKQDEMVSFLIEKVLPTLNLHDTYELSLRCKLPVVKKNTDERLMEIGMAEFGKQIAFNDLVNRCKAQFKATSDKYRPNKLFKSVPATSESNINASANAKVIVAPSETESTEFNW